MMNKPNVVMERANEFLNRFEQASSLEERETIAAEYRQFLTTLNDADRDKVRTIMSGQWEAIGQEMNSLQQQLAAFRQQYDHAVA